MAHPARLRPRLLCKLLHDGQLRSSASSDLQSLQGKWIHCEQYNSRFPYFDDAFAYRRESDFGDIGADEDVQGVCCCYNSWSMDEVWGFVLYGQL